MIDAEKNLKSALKHGPDHYRNCDGQSWTTVEIRTEDVEALLEELKRLRGGGGRSLDCKYLDEEIPVYLDGDEASDYAPLEAERDWLSFRSGHSSVTSSHSGEPKKYPCWVKRELYEDPYCRDHYTYYFVYPVSGKLRNPEDIDES